MTSGHRASWCVLIAIVVGISDNGLWSGTVWSSVSSSQRILSLWFDRFSTDRIAQQPDEAQRHCGSSKAGNDRQSARIVFGKRGNLDLVVAVNRAAEQLGLSPGLALAQARAMHPAVVAVAEDQTADTRLLDAIADWCQRYTPLLAVDPPDGILLDISGCAHLFGSEQELRKDLLARMTNFGFSARAAIAATIGAAWAAAHFSNVPITPAGDERKLLAPLPLAALRISQETVAALGRLGFKFATDLLDVPRAALAARFGVALLRNLDRALGHEDEPLTPRLPVAPYLAEKRFPEPIAREEDVLATIERLAAQLKIALTTHGDGARRLELALFRTDDAVKRLAVGTSRPVREPQAIRALFVERLAALGEDIDPGFGFDLARLSILVAEPCPEEQIGLGGGEQEAELDRLVDRLSARLGRSHVARLLARDSHIPEFAVEALSAQLTTSAQTGWDAFRRFSTEAQLSARPLRLLAKPEPIDDLLALVPDGPPVRFRWRRAWHEVVAAEGPERIEGDWWSEYGGGPTRDYFRVEDKTGLRFWLFRAGLYRDLARGSPRWFLHGMYA
jgi:protein ImuB